MPRLGWCLLFVLLGLCPQAHADVYNELHGLRSLAMGGAHRGLGGSNDALILNPGAMAVSKRYGVDVLYDYGGGDERLSHIHLSAVDSKSGPVAGGLAYTHDWGNSNGQSASLHRFYVGSAVSLGDFLGVGLTGQTVRGEYTAFGQHADDTLYNVTAGVALNIGNVLGLGAVYQNILKTADPNLLAPTLGFGASLRTGLFAVAADLSLDMRTDAHSHATWNVGGEYFLFDLIATRIGWRLGPGDPAGTGANRSYLAGGVELVTGATGFGVSGEKGLGVGPPSWRLLAGLRLFF